MPTSPRTKTVQLSQPKISLCDREGLETVGEKATIEERDEGKTETVKLGKERMKKKRKRREREA